MSAFSSREGRPLILGFEGWNDAGEAASSAVRAIVERYSLDASFSVDTETFYDYSQGATRPTIDFVPDEGRRITWPTASLFVPSDLGTNVYAILGTEPSRSWPTFAATFLDEALAHDVTSIIVVGSQLADAPHTRPIEVAISSDNARVREELGCERSQYEGPIGIPTVIAQFAEQVGLPTVSLWASFPHYVHHSHSPKVTLALLEEIQRIADLDIDLGEWAERALEWESSIDEIAENDEDMSEYIHRLEEDRDAATAPDASGDAIAAEFEQFLRSKEDGGPEA